MRHTYQIAALALVLALTSAHAGELKWSSPDSWAPMSQEEINDSHTCFMGTFIAICAGDKRIATGIIIANQIHGTLLSGVDPDISFPRDLLPKVADADSYTAMMSLTQNPESGGPAWKKTYYVLSDDELAHIIEHARRDPEWKPHD